MPEPVDPELVERLYATDDAMVWAKAFCGLFIISTAEGVIQDAEGLMVGWFANAMGVAVDQDKKRQREDEGPLDG